MRNFKPLLMTVALAASFSIPALSQGAASTLRVDQGQVMTSSGGEFVTAHTGQAMAIGERVMITKGSSATLLYGNGCTRHYTAPGVYTVESDCEATVVSDSDGVVDWKAVGILAGVTAIGAAILASQDDSTNIPPVSR